MKKMASSKSGLSQANARNTEPAMNRLVVGASGVRNAAPIVSAQPMNRNRLKRNSPQNPSSALPIR